MVSPKKEASWFYWWYEYLKRHKGYRNCCKRKGHGAYSGLYRRFGNIHRVPFDRWWPDHEWLFYGLDFVAVYHHRLKELFYWEGIAPNVLLEVDLRWPKRQIQKEFNELLRKLHSGRRGRPKWNDAACDYPLYCRPDVRSLEKMLKIYDLRENTDLTLWEIGEKLNLNPSEMSAGKDDKDRRRVMTALVSRYLRHAKIIISNTGKGIFPKKTI